MRRSGRSRRPTTAATCGAVSGGSSGRTISPARRSSRARSSSCPKTACAPAKSAALSDNRRRMDLDLVFLGASGSAPTARRAPTALLLRRGGERLLFDCAEGTQRQLMRSAVGLPDLDEIFITQLHADHYLGLPGMRKTTAQRKRDTPLTVYGPTGLRDLYGSLGRVFGKLSYPVQIEELRAGTELQRDEYRILAFPVNHGVSAVGYALVEDERPGRFDVEKAE